MLRSIAYTVAGLLLVGSAAQAQFLPRPGASGGGAGTPGGSPSVGGIGSAPSAGGFSPYLNLTRGGNSAAVNYYGIVRPQMSFQNSIQSLQQQQQGGGNGTESDDPTMPFMVVGTRARFLNTGGYFLNMGGSSAGAGTGSGQAGGAGGQSQFGSSSGGGFTSVATAASAGMGVFLGGNQSGARGGNRGGRR